MSDESKAGLVDFWEAAKVLLDESGLALQEGRHDEAKERLQDAQDCMHLAAQGQETSGGTQPMGTTESTAGAIWRPVCLTEATLDELKLASRWLSQPEHDVEHLIARYLGREGEILGRYHHTDNLPQEGTIDFPTIIREAKAVKAASLWLAHNHPRKYAYYEAQQRHWAGAIEPSAQDLETLAYAHQVCRESGLVLADFVIAGPNAMGWSARQAAQPRMLDARGS